MEGWNSSDGGIGGTAGLSILGGGEEFRKTDVMVSRIMEMKKELQRTIEESESTGEARASLVELLMASCDGDTVTVESILRTDPQLVNQRYPKDEEGVGCLVYAICYENEELVERILSQPGVDVDLHDTVVFYTPLMWAVYLDQIEVVKMLLNHQADIYKAPRDDGKDVLALLSPEHSEVYEYFRSRNLITSSGGAAMGAAGDVYYNEFMPPSDPFVDDLSAQIKLQSITPGYYHEFEENEQEAARDEEAELANDPILATIADFEYDKLHPDTYLKFSDGDIPALLDYTFNLRSDYKYQHESKMAAAVVFQLVRYAHQKAGSRDLTEFFFECFTARLRSATNTKSGVFNMATADETAATTGTGDIVLLSYWLAAIQFLHFYFSKGDIYKSYPRFLQEIISLTQSLVATLSFAINSRLDILVDDCLLNFTNLVDVSNVLYAKDWNLFKKSKSHPSSYDDILKMLYPPSQNELMKPSPIRYIQVLGALEYVLKIHSVHDLLKLQTYSQVFSYVNAILFNRIIGQNKYCSRSKAIQIRLNISAIEDWLRSHNYKVYKPDTIGHLSKLLAEEDVKLHSILSEETQDTKDPHSLAFYYTSLFHVGKRQLQATIELLQWLQCMSSLQDEESLVITINQFDTLNYYQILKVTNKMYRYEVEEPKMPKKLVNYLKNLVNEQGENQVSTRKIPYMTQSTFLSKEVYIYVNPNYVYPVALPNLPEMIAVYGAGLGGMRVYQSRQYQPSLPVSVIDDIDEIRNANKYSNPNETYDYDDASEGNDSHAASVHGEGADGKEEDGPHQGSAYRTADEPYGRVQLPLSLAHKNWGDGDELDVNPW